MAQPDPTSQCGQCVYWELLKVQPNKPDDGLCHRLPKHENKTDDDWCGEWSERRKRDYTSLRPIPPRDSGFVEVE